MTRAEIEPRAGAKVAALVLCGGRSLRMGCSKAWLPFGEQTMLERVVRRVGEVANPVVVVAAVGQELPELGGCVEVARDEVPDGGPLQGLVAGLGALRETAELVFATSTDAPFVEPRWIEGLADLMEGYDVAIPFVDGKHQPLAAVYRRAAAAEAARNLLRSGRTRLQLLTERLRTRLVSSDELRGFDPDLATLRNLNTIEEYETALRGAGIELSSRPGIGPTPGDEANRTR